MLKRIFNVRPDLYISSNMPYESRFYFIIKHGNMFGKNISDDNRFDSNTNKISNELIARSKGLSKDQWHC